jgi:hypothetical protein
LGYSWQVSESTSHLNDNYSLDRNYKSYTKSRLSGAKVSRRLPIVECALLKHVTALFYRK